jgi:glutamyl-tRNA synthetase
MTAPIRVRFAPSPTGYLHVGGLRTALYNYLFARKHGGIFVLRIEDTDQTRFVPGAIEKLIDSLKWAGLDHDEGPGAGGPHEPYRQSERLALYRKASEHLLASGSAYRCFCTPERLKAMREGKTETKYDGTCRRLAPKEAEAKLAAGIPYTVRLAVPEDETVVVEDLVRGKVEFATAQIDDQVLVKSDGFPTYHLANVVDDHEMEISHVIRGEEWLTSTPKHLLLYRALGFELPQFAHLPLLLNPDRSKLSKRQGDVAVEDYRDQGYFPEALVNFVAFLGWNPGHDREVFTLSELVDEFSLERVNKSGAIFNVEKLRWFNSEHLRRRPVEEILAELRPLLKEREWDERGDVYLTRVVELMRDRLTFVHEFPSLAEWFFVDPSVYDEAAARKRWTPGSAELLREILPRLGAVEPFDPDALECVVKSFAESKGVATGDLIHPLRLAVSGVGRGPGLFEMLAVLGRESVLRRVNRAIAELG